MFYLTFNDYPSGIFSSQVVDVCRYLNSELNVNVRLVSFISIRGFFQNRKKIRSQSPDSIVLPMIPGRANWKWNTLLFNFICVLYQPKSIMARGVFAANLALFAKQSKKTQKVIYDVRAAGVAEFKEYGISPDLVNELTRMEKFALEKSDFRLAVSNKLVDYWKKEFNISNPNTVVIPCTVESQDIILLSDEQKVNKRKELGFSSDDLVLTYSGSIAGWQSIAMITDFAAMQLQSDLRIKMLFLCHENADIIKFSKMFPNRVVVKWVKPSLVNEYLQLCDYGLLIRNESLTNKVSSPTKFAEYLRCGLSVIISEGIGDFSEFVGEKKCGIVISAPPFKTLPLSSPLADERTHNRLLATRHFLKSSFREEYKKIVQ